MYFSFNLIILQPFDEETWYYFGNHTDRIAKEHPRTSFDDLKQPIAEWHKETYKLSVDFVYKNIKENEVPSDEYIQNGIKVAERQIAKGGYRLADLLIQMWPQQPQQLQSFLQ